MRKLAATFVLLALSAALATGCGSSDESTRPSTPRETGRPPAAPIGAAARSCETEAIDAEGLRVSGVSCATGRQVMFRWQRSAACAPPAGASRGGCASGPYRCAGTRAGRGLAVSCSRPGRSVAFVVRRP